MHCANKISVVIVNWNSGEQLYACVNSVVKHAQELVNKIIVVDNASIDGSTHAIANMPKVDLILTGINNGFGKACNLGASHANSEYILFLNPDACLFPDSLQKLFEFVQKSENSKVGIFGVQLIDSDGHIARSCARFPTSVGLIAHAVGIDRIFPTLGHFMIDWDHTTSRQVDHVIGAFYLVRRCVFDQLYGFDERYFVYLEDLDFSYRAKKIGWSCFYFTEAQAFHAGGGTSEQVKAKRLFYSLRSRILFASKHFNIFGALMVLMTTLCIEPFSRAFHALCLYSWRSMLETSAAYGMLFRWLPVWIFKGITR